MKTKFTVSGSPDQPMPEDRDCEIKFQNGDLFYHENSHKHIEYKVKEVKFVLDDCYDQFYQLVELESAEYDKEMDVY